MTITNTSAAPSAFICVKCGRRFSRKADSVRHVETHDEHAKRYKCAWPGCAHSTLQKSNLKTHFLATHLRVRQFHCTIGNCRDAFGDHSSLIRHEKHAHGYYRKCHPYERHRRRMIVDLHESVYMRDPVPRIPAASPATFGSEVVGTTSSRSSVSAVPSPTSGTSFSSPTDDITVESPRGPVTAMLKSPAPQGFTCDGGPRDPFANPIVFEEFISRIPRLENLL